MAQATESQQCGPVSALSFPTIACLLTAQGTDFSLAFYLVMSIPRAGLASKVAIRFWGGRDTGGLVHSNCPSPAAWQQVERQLDGSPADASGPRPVQYVENTPDPRLQSEPSPTPCIPTSPLASTSPPGSSPSGLGREDMGQTPPFSIECSAWHPG